VRPLLFICLRTTSDPNVAHHLPLRRITAKAFSTSIRTRSRSTNNRTPSPSRWSGSRRRKHHSKAKGGEPVDETIRGLARIALCWAAKVNPRAIMLEKSKRFSTGPADGGRRPRPEAERPHLSVVRERARAARLPRRVSRTLRRRFESACYSPRDAITCQSSGRSPRTVASASTRQFPARRFRTRAPLKDATLRPMSPRKVS
jgi:hypothetical protein